MLATYTIYTTPSGKRSFDKLPQDVKEHLVGEFQTLKTNPLKGEKLKGALGFLRSLHTRFIASDYRVAYEVVEKNLEIVIHYIASRENFYKQLSRLNLKRSK